MNKNVFACLLTMLAAMFMFSSCEWMSGNSSGDDYVYYDIKPIRMDVQGVKGFVVAENAAASKADADQENTAPYALYSIDEEGNIKLSVFYFEVVSMIGEDSVETTATLKREISNAFQVIPTLVSDLEKYILFSGCYFQLNTAGLSDKALKICEAFINSPEAPYSATYLIRKSDGALFDISGPDLHYSYFTYRYVTTEDRGASVEGLTSMIDIGRENIWWQLAPRLWKISPSGKLYSYSYAWDGSVVGGNVYKYTDNGDAVDVMQCTQPYEKDTEASFSFLVDKTDNVYCLPQKSPVNGQGWYLDIYLANGRFNTIKLGNADDDIFLMDMQTDTQGNPYLLYFKNSCIVVALLSDGQCQEVLTHPIEITGGYIANQSDPIFMGNIDGAMHWIYGSNINGSGNPKDAQYKHVVYTPATNSFDVIDFKEDIEDMLSDAYDAFAMSDKVYAAKVSDQSIMVKEYDPFTRSSRQYTLDVDVSETLVRQYTIIVQDAPYLIVDGRSAENGSYVSFKINLLNGENNASFSADARKVTSFFRIN
ncbi:MAG: hypothetical protein J6R71_04915 [Bacteroidales bacterium]|nr:hypothetical protein [Bacteroidales bacterium]MBO5846980.1 hypothetical protein [Bacteroidales bacterium]